MVFLIIFMLLFNLTYILPQDFPDETIFHNSLVYGANDSNLKINGTSNAQSSTKKISDKKNIEAPTHVLKMPTNPFFGKGDHKAIQRGVEKVNADENKKIPNNEGHNKVPAFNDSNKQDVVKKPKQDSSNPSIQTKGDNTTGENKKMQKTTTVNPNRLNTKENIMESGALLRGFCVFLGLSVITMLYFVFRSYRLRHAAQPSTTVRKYGITARRSDMEMRHLELDDEDDDTLFEIGNHNALR